MQRLHDAIASGEIEVLRAEQKEGRILPVGRVLLSIELEYDRKREP